ncbi:MAG: GvpL/GvpF family gas vesicle protein [Pseudanabaenaceae cyanobacterium bins.39]|nr:GvpL/GvpF family gas vesicle protein [Pseudanabaenaceae cyanobacterium bins.39]
MIYTFAILMAPCPKVQPLGLMGQPIQYWQCDRLVAVIQPDVDIEALKSLPEESLMQAIIQHDRLVCDLFTEQTLLPLRFGTAFISLDALDMYLRQEGAKLLGDLERLTGYAEFLIKGVAIAPKVEPQTNLKGKDYLLAKRSLYLQQEEWRSQLQQEISSYLQLIKDNLESGTELHIHSTEPQGSESWRCYLLLPRSQADYLQNLGKSWLEKHRHWQIEWTEALPPYHFLA